MPLADRLRSLRADRVTVVLLAVFLLAAIFYLWLAAYMVPLALHGSHASPYNQLADAFLHLHLWVARAPAALLRLREPYLPREHLPFQAAFPDYAFYGHYLYLTWGPAPVLVLLLPLHLLGFEPSGSVILAPFAIAGLGFALATLRVLLRQIGDVPLWMCVLAALVIALCSAVPYDVGYASVYHQAVAAGYCFTMAGVWLAMSAIADRRASLTRLLLMSLCFGLAVGSRPPLGLAAAVLLPVYLSLRRMRPRRVLLLALGAPFGVCIVLLAAYNQARFGEILQYGTKYQLDGEYVYTAHWGTFSYLPPGLWSYLMTPPRLSILFPFVVFIAPRISYPLALPVHYLSTPEVTGGLLALSPVVIFLLALPWIWRRRPAALGPLAMPLLVLAGAGTAMLLFLAYEFFATTERYEVDYTTLLLFGALAAWLTLSTHARRRCWRAIRVGGGLLAVWSCLTGVAIAFNEMGEKNTRTWRTLATISAPLSTAIAVAAGHPVLADVNTAHIFGYASESYSRLGTDVTAFWLGAHEQANITIVSPDTRQVALVADLVTPVARSGNAPVEVRSCGSGHARYSYRLTAPQNGALIPVPLSPGVNRFCLGPAVSAASAVVSLERKPQPLLAVTGLRLADH